MRYLYIILAFGLAACSAAPPARYTVSHDQELNREGVFYYLQTSAFKKMA